MTKEKAAALLPTITAFAQGAEIECCDIDGEWLGLTDPAFSSAASHYRVKPEPDKPEPWAAEKAALKAGKKIEFRSRHCSSKAWNPWMQIRLPGWLTVSNEQIYEYRVVPGTISLTSRKRLITWSSDLITWNNFYVEDFE